MAKPWASTLTVSDDGVVALPGLTVSHEPPEAVAVKGCALELVTWTVFDAVSDPPVTKLKARLRGQTFKKERVDEPTMRVTGTFRGVSEEFAGVTATVPRYVPAARPDVCTATVRLPGVVPDMDPRISQLPPVVVPAVAV